jgi:hypothetical protein
MKDNALFKAERNLLAFYLIRYRSRPAQGFIPNAGSAIYIRYTKSATGIYAFLSCYLRFHLQRAQLVTQLVTQGTQSLVLTAPSDQSVEICSSIMTHLDQYSEVCNSRVISMDYMALQRRDIMYK